MMKIAIIGTGGIASAYMQALRWGNANCRFKLQPMAAVNRSEQGNARAVALGIDNVYLDIDVMIEKEQPDGLICSVGATEIVDVMKKLIPYGIPILVEKPPGLNIGETEQLLAMAQSYRTSVMVGFNRRFYSVVEQAKQQIDVSGGLLGMRLDGFERYRMLKEQGYTAEALERLLTTNSIHCIDLIRFYAGDILDVHAFENQFSKEPFNHRYAAMIRTQSNVAVTFQAFWHALGNWSYELYIPDGRISFSNLEKGVYSTRSTQVVELTPQQEDIEAKPGFVRMLEYFANHVVRLKTSYNGKHSLLDAVETMDLIRRLSFSKQ
ncbi:putative dehydrogenase [Paenibacillus taihuensis]|uniref:Putative dehydrogenase n=1 Tax=Paenibacillus taihuensis TaxID=1156355 RepID=A0A3D9RWY1_9BACL|nr:Gfo/Idh/MocA family oxidoreductase [Paenibacillus taihuensis]REE84499.1 putative dehydrogenase [Paenibacillus taihuensis]